MLHPLRMMEAAFVELENLRGFLFTITHRMLNLNDRLWKAEESTSSFPARTISTRSIFLIRRDPEITKKKKND